MKSIASYDWKSIYDELNKKGHALLKGVCTSSECKALASSYDDDGLFRKTINMARYRFGSGEYRYYDYPLPPLVQVLREEIYYQLSPLANNWMKVLKTGTVYPREHSQFIKQCSQHDQSRPTPLQLKYSTGDYNTLHQDLYGDVYFPMQAIVSLSKRSEDYSGGELVLTEQIPRAQSKAMVVTPDQGDIIIVTTQFRPQKGSRGHFRINMKHGVSEVKVGIRQTLGIIFHDSK